MNEELLKYTDNDIQQKLNNYLPILYRILKSTDHYSAFIYGMKMLSTQKEGYENFNKTLINFAKSIIGRATAYYRKDDYWSIHKNVHIGIGWEKEFYYYEINDNIKMVITMVFGMALNVCGLEIYDRGLFYDDYQLVKHEILDD